jgi:hypothetical protein
MFPSPVVTLPAFPGSHNPRVYFREWSNLVLDAAAAMNPQVRNGVLGFLMTPQQWALTFPDLDPFQPREEPPPHVNGVGNPNAWPQQQLDIAAYLTEARAVSTFKTALLLAIDRPFQTALQDAAGSTRDTTLLQIMETLRDLYGVPTPAELHQERLRLEEVFLPTEDLTKHIDMHMSVHAMFHVNQQPLSEAAKVQLLMASLMPCGLFQMGLDQFRVVHFTLADQTFGALVAMVRRHEQHSNTSGSRGYALSAQAPSTRIATLEDTVRKLQEQLRSTRTQPYNRNTTPRNSPTVPRFWCWSHGRSDAPTGHNSSNCPDPRAGHQSGATFSQQMRLPK